MIRAQRFSHRLPAPTLGFGSYLRRPAELPGHYSVDVLRLVANLSRDWMLTIGARRNGWFNNANFLGTTLKWAWSPAACGMEVTQAHKLDMLRMSPGSTR